jgi:hypothetical protein
MAIADWISAIPLFPEALRSQAGLTILENSRLWQNDRTVSRIKFIFILITPLTHDMVFADDQNPNWRAKS